MQPVQEDVDIILIPEIVSSLSRIPLDEVLKAVTALYLLQGAFMATSSSPALKIRGIIKERQG